MKLSIPPKHLYAYTLCFLVNIIFCLHYYAAKVVISAGVNPLALSAVRGIIGGTFLFLIYRDFFAKLNWHLIKNFALVAFFGFFFNQVFFLFGVKKTSPLNVAIIVNTIPVIITFLAVVSGLESAGKKKIAGLVIGFIAVVLLSAVSNNFTFHDSNLGDLFILLNVVFYGISVILSKKLLQQEIAPHLFPIGVLLFGGMMHALAGCFYLPELFTYAISGPYQGLLILYEAIVSTGLVYLMIFLALKILPPSATTIFAYLQPVIILCLDFFFLDKIPAASIFPIILAIIASGYMVISSRE